MSKKRKRINEENPGSLCTLPVAFIITIVPLIVFMKVTELTQIEVINWYGESTYTDFFSYYKSQWLIIGTVMAVVFYLAYSLVKGFKFQKSFLYIPAAVYAALIILSTVTSEFPQIALRGFVARYEGMFVLLCYLALMFIVFNLVKTESQIRFLFGALLISASVIGIIGFFQFLGIDLFRSDFGKQLILPAAYQNIADKLSFRFEKTAVYSTLSNTNYVGSYVPLLIPIAAISFVYFKKPFLKICSALLTVILVICLFGSRSRAGLVGLVIAILVSVILFRKAIFKRKLPFILAVAGVLVLFFGANYALNGVLTDRILSEFTQDSGNETQFFDLKDITFKDNTASIISATETLVMKNEDLHLYFYDGNGKELEYEMTDQDGTTVVKFAAPEYKDYNLTVANDIVTVNQKQAQFKFRAGEDNFKLIGINGDETSDIEKPETLGFSGHERLGSARGYIWSRTLPMLKKALFLGYGPDTYAIEFPQKDYIGKIRAYGTAQMIVDKPHNTYLQIAANTGFLSLIAVLVLWGFYIVQSLRLYIRSMDGSFIRLSGAGIFIAICGYLTAAFFNDSVVGIAPVFWVLLGLGFVCNRINKRSGKEHAKSGQEAHLMKKLL